jgi:hypothetical protein
MTRTSHLFVTALPLVLGCSGSELPSPSLPEAPSLPAPAALPYVPATPYQPYTPKPANDKRWTSDSDNTAELYDCLGPSACPASLAERAKRRAAASFGCTPEEITATERHHLAVGVKAPSMLFSARGTVQLHLDFAKKGDAFDVSGCGQKGLLACVWANRSVQTSSASYQNTDDRVCLWASE